MAQAQEHAEMSLEETEGIVARTLAELPEVAAVYYTAGGNYWNLTVLHDYAGIGEGVAWVTCKLGEAEEKVPHLDIRPMILPASKIPAGDMRQKKLIYER